MRSYKSLSVFNKFRLSLLCVAMSITFSGNCTVNVEKSRVVFNADQFTSSLSLHNSEKEPTLVQLWTDNGDPLATPDSVKTPIIINPPVFIMKPSEVRNIRLLLIPNAELPRDRESLFWLNVYQIPPNTEVTPSSQRKVILPLKIRLKVFVRPDSVGYITKDDFSKIKLTKINDFEVRISNPTKWYITIPSMKIDRNKINPFMLSPYTEKIVHVPERINKGMDVNYDVIDDQGVLVSNTSTLW